MQPIDSVPFQFMERRKFLMYPVKVGIVGYGMMGKMHARVWSEIPGTEVVAIAEPMPDRQDEIRQMHACPVFSNLLEMLMHGPKPDIIVVATHAPCHVSDTLRALYCGCHVICEKPMALTLGECDIMVATARNRNLKLAINHQSVFSRTVTVAEQKIVAGDIGELYAIKAYGKGRIACSDLMEIAGHLLHVMWYFANGAVTEVFGDVTYKGRPVIKDDVVRIQDLYSEGRDSGYGAGDRMFGYYKFSNGVRGELHLEQLSGAPSTFGESRNFGYFIELCGTAGRMQFYLPRVLFFNSSPYDDLAKDATPWIEVDPRLREERDPMLIKRFNEQFLTAIREDKDPVVSGSIGRMVMEMTLGVYASHFAGQPLLTPLGRKHPFEVS